MNMPFQLSHETVRALISLAIIVLANVIAFITVRVINRKIDDIKRRHSARKAALYIITFLAIITISALWIKSFQTFSVVISVIGAGMVVALGDVFLGIAGWFLIIFRRPYGAGDRIQIGEVKGDVIDIRLFQTFLLEVGNWVKEDQSTGRVVHIPNSELFKNPVFNYTRGFEFIWDEIKIVLTFESDWKKAEKIMLSHAQKEADKVSKTVRERIRKMAEKYLIFYEKLSPIVYTKIVDNGIELSLRYLTEAKKRRYCRDSINRSILDDFGKERGIAFAYPTYRLVK